jgi:hypothetical protein
MTFFLTGCFAFGSAGSIEIVPFSPNDNRLRKFHMDNPSLFPNNPDRAQEYSNISVPIETAQHLRSTEILVFATYGLVSMVNLPSVIL